MTNLKLHLEEVDAILPKLIDICNYIREQTRI